MLIVARSAASKKPTIGNEKARCQGKQRALVREEVGQPHFARKKTVRLA